MDRNYQKVWFLRLQDGFGQRAFWLRFSVLSSTHGFKRLAEIWAVFFEKSQSSPGKTEKMLLKKTYPITECTFSEEEVRIGPSNLTKTQTQGTFQAKGRTIYWDLQFQNSTPFHLQFVPHFTKAKLIRNTFITQAQSLSCYGTTSIDEQTTFWQTAPGSLGYFSGTQHDHGWLWGQCSSFVDTHGLPASFHMEGLSIQPKLGPFSGPPVCSFYFYYQRKHYCFNTLKDAFLLRSHYHSNLWTFQANHKELSFRGTLKTSHQDAIGLTYEDTRGSFMYSSNTQLSYMEISVYRSGILEAKFIAPGTASLEVVSRKKNPYIALLS